ncbi:MAG: hypothetical protein SWC96_10960 [Thermodesulfobacteriota bacterium]|nr:hypothetical protein [Thermodesulfobacteriota bacterium]
MRYDRKSRCREDSEEGRRQESCTEKKGRRQEGGPEEGCGQKGGPEKKGRRQEGGTQEKGGSEEKSRGSETQNSKKVRPHGV